ncbi:MAG: hypothetical protein J6Y03_03875 [Alphaproteobacteria bacterium]|nr:hypothetical protein [Alphaproteobacteria bacterium]
MLDANLDKIERITDIPAEFSKSVCGNDNLFTLIKGIIAVVRYNISLFYKGYYGKNIKVNNIRKNEWLVFLNLPVSNLKYPIVKRYLNRELTKEDKDFIKSHKKYRQGLPFIRKSLLVREILATIQKIIDLKSPLSSRTQEQVVHLYILSTQLFIADKRGVLDNIEYNAIIRKEKLKTKLKRGGLQKGKNAEPFKQKMYEEQKQWFYEKKSKGITPIAKDFAKRYYKQCKEKYDKDNTIKFPFHFTKEVEKMDYDNAFIYLTKLAQKINNRLKEEYQENKK